MIRKIQTCVITVCCLVLWLCKVDFSADMPMSSQEAMESVLSEPDSTTTGTEEVSTEEVKTQETTTQENRTEETSTAEETTIVESTTDGGTLDYVTVNEDVYVISTVHFRAGASTASESYEVLTRGTVVKRIGYHDDWSKVIYNGIEGYMASPYLSIVPPTPYVAWQKQEIHTLSPQELAEITDLPSKVGGYGQDRAVDEWNRPLHSLSVQSAYGVKYGVDYFGHNPKKNYLMFDMGWENTHDGIANTDKVLDVLKETGVKASFFVTHAYARDNPAIIRRIIDEGHRLGSHGYFHPSAGIASLSLEEQMDDTMRMQNYIKDNFNYNMECYNFSSSLWSERSMALLQRMGYRLTFYTVNYPDWDVNDLWDTEKAFNHLYNARHPGAVYMLHTVSDTNVSILKRFIEEIRAAGYEFGEY